MRIRPIITLEDCRRVVALEMDVWDYTDAEDVIPAPMLIVGVKRGAILLGAFDAADQMKGFVYSIPAIRDGHLTQWSHMLGVARDARGAGLGRRLKLAQREHALAMGIELIEWTFDPMQALNAQLNFARLGVARDAQGWGIGRRLKLAQGARARAMGIELIEWTFDPMQALNAHLNFARLGVVAEEYEENIYGESSSPLHLGTPTDRLVAEWKLTAPHVERRIASDGIALVRDASVSSAPLVNPSREAGGQLLPGAANLSIDARRLLVEIPTGFSELQARDPALALEWRLAIRSIFQTYFSKAYRAVDFFLSQASGRGQYLLALGPE